MYDLTNLAVTDLAVLSRSISGVSHSASSMEGCASAIIRLLYDHLGTPDGERACVLVRFFKTHSLGDLSSDLRATAVAALPGVSDPNPGMKCLTLLASAGVEPAWNSRHSSAGHKVIPLPSVKLVEQFPMISQLIRQLGFRVSDIIEPELSLGSEMQQRGSNVFYVEQAAGSPHIPAQEGFVSRYGVRTVVGFGDVLPSGNLFVIVLFTRAHVPRDRAEMLNILSMGVKGAVLRFDYGTVFESAVS